MQSCSPGNNHIVVWIANQFSFDWDLPINCHLRFQGNHLTRMEFVGVVSLLGKGLLSARAAQLQKIVKSTRYSNGLEEMGSDKVHPDIPPTSIRRVWYRYDEVCCPMSDRTEPGEDVPEWSVVVFVDEFQLVATRHSKHCCPLEYPRDVPKREINDAETQRNNSLTAFLGGAFIWGGRGGTRKSSSRSDEDLAVWIELTGVVLVICRVRIGQWTKHVGRVDVLFTIFLLEVFGRSEWNEK